MSKKFGYLPALLGTLALMLIGCEPSITEQKAAAAQPHVQVAGPATLNDSTTSAVTTADGQITTIQLPDAPHFEVPLVALSDAAAAQRINKTLLRLLLTAYLEDSTHLRTAPQAIRQAKAKYEANHQIGVFGTSFEVLYKQRNLLSLELTTEYSGAYPWSATRHATFNLHTGKQVNLTDLLADTLALRRYWYARINMRLAAYRKEVARYHADTEDAWATVRECTGWSDTLQQVRPAVRPPLREFALTTQGLVLYTSFEFPHVAMDLAPPDNYAFSLASIQSWLSNPSPLRSAR